MPRARQVDMETVGKIGHTESKKGKRPKAKHR